MRQSAVSVTCACLWFSLYLASASFAGAELSSSTAISSTNISAKSVAHYITGVSHDLLNDMSAAVREYEWAVQSDPTAPVLRARLASAYMSVRAFDGATREIKTGLQLSPDDQDLQYLLATAYLSSGERELAFKTYEGILKKLSPSDPSTVGLYFLLGKLYYSMGEVGKAVLQFEKVLELKPDDADMAYLLGGYYASSGIRVRAVPFYQQCIKTDPFHAPCLNGLGYLYAEDGKNLEEAKLLVKRALDIDPKNAAYMDSLGWVYFHQGAYIEALRELSAAAELMENPEIYEHLGDVYTKLGDEALAQLQWKKSLALDPDQPALRAKVLNQNKPSVVISVPVE